MTAPTLDDPLQVHREGLVRAVAFDLVRAEPDSSGDGLTIEGYGAVTGSPTTIDSWEGTFDEVIAAGAFRKTLRERTPKMQFDHGRHPLLGSLPLGVWTTAEEDARGLHLIGRLSDNWLVQPFRDAISDGGVEGMSFRFTVVREQWTDKDGKTIKDEDLMQLLYYGAGDRGPILRTLKELSVSEAGPVVWPAYDETSVGVRGGEARSITIDLAALRSPAARRDLARAVVLADAAATHPGLDATLVSHAEFVAARERGVVERLRPTNPTGEPPVRSTTPEPRTTAGPADEHTAPAVPPVTVAPAGDHSSTTPRAPRSAAAMRSAISRRTALLATLNTRK
jgi:HK97 family phage prohead protease